jgi:hypothetical protein
LTDVSALFHERVPNSHWVVAGRCGFRRRGRKYRYKISPSRELTPDPGRGLSPGPRPRADGSRGPAWALRSAFVVGALRPEIRAPGPFMV